MAKKRTIFYCKDCGNESSRWLGQCPACGEWDTLVEEPVIKKSKRSSSTNIRASEPSTLDNIKIEDNSRFLLESGKWTGF